MRQVVLDTETTGLRPSEGHRVIEIAAIEIIDYLPTGKNYQQYINPQRDVPETSFKVHGLSYEFLKDKPLFEQIVNEFLEFVGKDPIIAHNVDFDIGFLNYELNACGKDSLKMKKLTLYRLLEKNFQVKASRSTRFVRDLQLIIHREKNTQPRLIQSF